MQPESPKYLHDIYQACEAIFDFIKGKNLEDYNRDLLLRSGIKRQLMIIGEAVNHLKDDSDVAERIDNLREIINLRNVIVHGYNVV